MKGFKNVSQTCHYSTILISNSIKNLFSLANFIKVYKILFSVGYFHSVLFSDENLYNNFNI